MSRPISSFVPPLAAGSELAPSRGRIQIRARGSFETPLAESLNTIFRYPREQRNPALITFFTSFMTSNPSVEATVEAAKILGRASGPIRTKPAHPFLKLVHKEVKKLAEQHLPAKQKAAFLVAYQQSASSSGRR